MKFGQVDNPKKIDLTLPDDHPETKNILEKNKCLLLCSPKPGKRIAYPFRLFHPKI